MMELRQVLIGGSLVVLISIALLMAISHIMEGVTLSMSGISDEYQRYENIRDSSNCTQMNDTYCKGRSGCIHAYEYCQRIQCPGELP